MRDRLDLLPSVRFDELTYLEIRKAAAAGFIAVVPTGCTEQQGPHLPTGFDTWFAETLMVAAARHASKQCDVRALVLPAMPFGPTPEHLNYGSGYIHIPVGLHDLVIRAVLDSLAAQGFRRIVLWQGCGGHALDEIVERFNVEHSGRARAFIPVHPYHAIWCRIGDASVPGGHADSFTTSIMLHLRPEAVRQDQIFDPQSQAIDWTEPNLDFSRYSRSGVIGDPTHASAELGSKLWEAVVESAARTLSEIAIEAV